jgi:hypothetical protein
MGTVRIDDDLVKNPILAGALIHASDGVDCFVFPMGVGSGTAACHPNQAECQSYSGNLFHNINASQHAQFTAKIERFPRPRHQSLQNDHGV